MAEVDRRATASGVASFDLMENAGRAVSDALRRRFRPEPVVVACGPGNNGGDGFVVARHLAAAGWPVRVGLLGSLEALKGDAAAHAARWTGAVEDLGPALLDGAAIVVDAIFGAGLARALGEVARRTVEAMRGRVVVAVDVPSGLDGSTGTVRGVAPQAALTVTFFRRKPGHLLLPGRALCGETIVADIGIPEAVLSGLGARCWANHPAMWSELLPRLEPATHKYKRGYALVLGGTAMTGAARLAARAAQRIGAGLVTLAAPEASWPVYATALESIIVSAAPFAALLADPRRNAVLVGPGAGRDEATFEAATAAVASGRKVVLDADALSVFEDRVDALRCRGDCVLTPHEGEFRRLFALGTDKLASVRAAAARTGCVVVLKGGDTVIAAPSGAAAINENAPPSLATGGTGDVLAGIVAGLLAQGMPAFEGACAAVWMHGAAAAAAGPHLIAEDLLDVLATMGRSTVHAIDATGTMARSFRSLGSWR
jgi:NAD(P)H-hydrate epimerase